MPYFIATVLSLILLLPQAAVSAQKAIDPDQDQIEELDANFGVEAEAAMRARFSDKVPQTVDVVTPADLAARAALVVEGTVADIYFTYEGPFNQPYTHTVINIARVLRGEHAEPTLTITQMGGPSQDGTMVNMVSHTEFFEIGERELLFLDVDAENARIKNRFRIYEGALYNRDGFGVVNSAEGGLRLSGTRNPAERFRRIQIGSETLYKNFSEPEPYAEDVADIDGNVPDGPAAAPAPPEATLTLDEFVNALEH